MVKSTAPTPKHLIMPPVRNVVILEGMRYCGKSTVGRLTAASFPAAAFIDVDTLVVETFNVQSSGAVALTCGDVVSALGWDRFRELEHAVMCNVLAPFREAGGGGPPLTLVACGGGFVEWAASFSLIADLATNNPAAPEDVCFQVYFLDKPLPSILRDKRASELKDGARPAYERAGELQEFEDVYWRRVPMYERLMSQRLVVGDAEPVANTVKRFTGLLQRALGPTASAMPQIGRLRSDWLEPIIRSGELPRRSHFVTLSCLPLGPSQWRCQSDLAMLLDTCATGCDVIEVRLDMLLSLPDLDDGDYFDTHYIPEAHALLHAIAAASPYLNVLATYRTAAEGGMGLDRMVPCGGDIPFLQRFWCALNDYSLGSERGLRRGIGWRWNPIDAVDLEVSSLPSSGPLVERLSPFIPFAAAAPCNPLVVLSVHDMFPVSVELTGLTPRREGFLCKVQELLSLTWQPWSNDCISNTDAGIPGLVVVPKYVCSATLFPTCHQPLPLLGDESLHTYTLKKLVDFAVPEWVKCVMEWLVVAVTTAGVVTGEEAAFLEESRLHSLTGRAMNRFLTPVTHPVLSSTGAPGQVSLRDLNTHRGCHQPMSFTLFGCPIGASKSPLIHNYIFRHWLGLGGAHYTSCETSNSDDVVAVICGEQWVGGSVTIPLKEEIATKHSDVVTCSEGALAMGAVNTLCRTAGGVLGYNTDWLALRDAVLDRLAEGGGVQQPSSAGGTVEVVVFGAGGTSRCAVYTALQLFGRGANLRLVIVNRTASNAEELRDSLIRGVDGASAVEWVVVSPHRPPCDVPQRQFARRLFVNTVPRGPGIGQLVRHYSSLQLVPQPAAVSLLADFAYVASTTADVGFTEALVSEGLIPSDTSCIGGQELLIRQALYQQLCWWRSEATGSPPHLPRFKAPYFPSLPHELVTLLKQ